MSELPYITTQVQALKSYPTYQFYARAYPKNCSLNDVFHICILESLRWIRSRLQGIDNLPNELEATEPEQFALFTDNKLTSFSYNNGFQIDVIYIDSLSVWSFRMTELDMGANLGTPRERLAVRGRSFTTEIAIKKQDNVIEIGIRTICSEPSDIEAPCEVFRPRVVKALTENQNLRLEHSGWILNGTPLVIKSKTELERFQSIFFDFDRSLPIIVIADSKTEIQKQPSSDFVLATPSITMDKYSLTGFSTLTPEVDVTINEDGFNTKSGLALQERKKPKSKTKKMAKCIEGAQVKTKLPTLDYSGLAHTLIGFAIVVFVEEYYFKQIENKIHIAISHGDVLIIPRQVPIERDLYEEYQNDLEGFYFQLRATVIEMQKRGSYSFGNVLFYSDAKLKEFHVKRHQTTSLEEKCSIYQQEKEELKAQIKELSQQHTDMQQTADALRIAKKRIEVLSSELEDKEHAYMELSDQMSSKESAYKRSAEIVQFYRQMIEVFATFPKDKNAVCNWIEACYAKDLLIASRAQSELRKYSGQLDLITLCDGIVFLSAYARYRRKEMSEDTLNMYAERCHWEIQGCGKEALKMHRDDYTVSINGHQYVLDQHIKHGVHADELIRIYFCWDDDIGKLIIGSMPGHLATVKNST